MKAFIAGGVFGLALVVVGYGVGDWQYWLLIAAGVVQYLTGMAEE